MVWVTFHDFFLNASLSFDFLRQHEDDVLLHEVVLRRLELDLRMDRLLFHGLHRRLFTAAGTFALAGLHDDRRRARAGRLGASRFFSFFQNGLRLVKGPVGPLNEIAELNAVKELFGELVEAL